MLGIRSRHLLELKNVDYFAVISIIVTITASVKNSRNRRPTTRFSANV